jgi:IclR family transcriptional regulator, blcABC operon repressor
VPRPATDEDVTGGRLLVPALDRALRILAVLEAQPKQPLTVSDIARRLGLPKSSTFNICAALVDGHFLRRSQGGFQLGHRLVQLGSAYVSSVDVVREFYDVCRAAPVDLRAIIQLAVLDDESNALYLANQDCNSGLQLGLSSSIGRRVPANCAACGKALLAALTEDELDRRLAQMRPLPRLTRRSITSRAKLEKELAAARERGYALDEEETVNGLSCIARAFATHQGETGFVAVSISTAQETLNASRRQTIAAILRKLVEALRIRV